MSVHPPTCSHVRRLAGSGRSSFLIRSLASALTWGGRGSGVGACEGATGGDWDQQLPDRVLGFRAHLGRAAVYWGRGSELVGLCKCVCVWVGWGWGG